MQRGVTSAPASIQSGEKIVIVTCVSANARGSSDPRHPPHRLMTCALARRSEAPLHSPKYIFTQQRRVFHGEVLPVYCFVSFPDLFRSSIGYLNTPAASEAKAQRRLKPAATHVHIDARLKRPPEHFLIPREPTNTARESTRTYA